MQMSLYRGSRRISSFIRSHRRPLSLLFLDTCSVVLAVICTVDTAPQPPCASPTTCRVMPDSFYGGRAVAVFQGAIRFNLAAKWWRGTSVLLALLSGFYCGESQSFTACRAPWTQLAGRFDSPAAAVTCPDSTAFVGSDFVVLRGPSVQSSGGKWFEMKR